MRVEKVFYPKPSATAATGEDITTPIGLLGATRRASRRGGIGWGSLCLLVNHMVVVSPQCNGLARLCSRSSIGYLFHV